MYIIIRIFQNYWQWPHITKRMFINRKNFDVTGANKQCPINIFVITIDYVIRRHFSSRFKSHAIFGGIILWLYYALCVHKSSWHTMTIKVFPSFLELFAYAGLVTSGPGRILPFVGGSTIESQGNSSSFFLTRHQYRCRPSIRRHDWYRRSLFVSIRLSLGHYSSLSSPQEER